MRGFWACCANVVVNQEECYGRNNFINKFNEGSNNEKVELFETLRCAFKLVEMGSKFVGIV